MNHKKLFPIAAVCLLTYTSPITFAHDGGTHKNLERSVKHQIRIKIDVEGEDQVFTFSRAELTDAKLIENKLAGLDDKTKVEVMNRLKMMKSHHKKDELIHFGEHEVDSHHVQKHMHKAEHQHKHDHEQGLAHEHKNEHNSIKEHHHADKHEKGIR